MQILNTVLFALQIISALVMIGLILVQQGKGADMGAAFGTGSSGSLFGASGSANFLSRSTAVLATVFFLCTLGLAFNSGARPSDAGSVLLKSAVPVAPDTAGSQAIPTAPTGAAVVPTPSTAPAVPASAAPTVPK